MSINIAKLSKTDNVFYPFFSLVEGELVEKSTEDGMGYYPITNIMLEIGCDTWIHNHCFTGDFVDIEDDSIFVCPRDLANDMIEKIKQCGTVNLEHWTHVRDINIDERSLDEKFTNEYQIEQAELYL